MAIKQSRSEAENSDGGVVRSREHGLRVRMTQNSPCTQKQLSLLLFLGVVIAGA